MFNKTKQNKTKQQQKNGGRGKMVGGGVTTISKYKGGGGRGVRGVRFVLLGHRNRVYVVRGEAGRLGGFE